MIQFDFNHADFKKNCAAVQTWLLLVHDTPLTEDEFVGQYRSLPHGHSSKGRHAPSNLRGKYRRLVQRFGFFAGGQG